MLKLMKNLFLGFTFSLSLASCAEGLMPALYPRLDFKPPALLSSMATDPRQLSLSFDEEIRSVPGSLALKPGAEISASAAGKNLLVNFAAAQSPGTDYSLAGEVEDSQGNRTRFVMGFTGWNDNVATLRLSEVQTGRSLSRTKPHRDFIELEVMANGNLGGVELSWTSSLRSGSYRFPSASVRKGSFVLLHLAPEGLPEEKDEVGDDLGLSGGVDSSPAARDFWLSGQALPDGSGAIALRLHPGEKPADGLFYATEERSGPIRSERLEDFLITLAKAGDWTFADAKPAWEDAFKWRLSVARSLYRAGAEKSPAGWKVSAAGSQSPGLANDGMSAETELRRGMTSNQGDYSRPQKGRTGSPSFHKKYRKH